MHLSVNLPLPSESNITTRRPENIAHINKRKVDMVKPDKFDGSTSWVNFKSHFEICAELNGWTLTEKGMYLDVALRGQAQSVLGNLPTEDRCNYMYRLLSKALEESFLPSNQTEQAVAGTKAEGLRVITGTWAGLASTGKLGLSNSTYRSKEHTCQGTVH
jgi:hypothetical protein